MLSAVYAVVVCLSVCVCVCVFVSVTLRYCIETAKRRITQITPHDSPMTSFLTQKIMAKFEQMQVGWVKIGHFPLLLELSTPNSVIIDPLDVGMLQ